MPEDKKPKAAATAVVKAFDGKVTLTFSVDFQPGDSAAIEAFYRQVHNVVTGLDTVSGSRVIWGE